MSYAAGSGTTNSGSINTQNIEQLGTGLLEALKTIARSDFGKALFALTFFISIVLIIFVPKARGYAVVALFVGFLLASYSGLVDTLWSFLGGIFGSA